ncbi:hypothetical protein CS545_08515 [Porphyromonas gingivalis]|nr:hypothetical protein CS545_08515 [Porphyromonas gingivalis]
MDTKQTEISPSFHQRCILEVCRDCMKYSFLRQINACVCLDQYEGGGRRVILCNDLQEVFQGKVLRVAL